MFPNSVCPESRVGYDPKSKDILATRSLRLRYRYAQADRKHIRLKISITFRTRLPCLPGTEVLPEHEMRITFLGSSPWSPNPLQKETSMLVELGNGTMQPRRFFFDLGNGSVGHAIALQFSRERR